jgi:hypothetical protein
MPSHRISLKTNWYFIGRQRVHIIQMSLVVLRTKNLRVVIYPKNHKPPHGVFEGFLAMECGSNLYACVYYSCMCNSASEIRTIFCVFLFGFSAYAETLPPKSGLPSLAQEKKWIEQCSSPEPHPSACYNLGVTEAQDRDNESKGIQYYKKACDLGEALGCFNLGGLLIKNRVGKHPVTSEKKRLAGAKAFQKSCELLRKAISPSTTIC